MKKRVRAVIIQNESILLIHRVKAGVEYWVFPGGGVEDSDASPEEALRRECREELGVAVHVGELLTEQAAHPSVGDQVELYFLCKILTGTIGTGDGPEFSRNRELSGTYKPEWISMASLSSVDAVPTEVRDKVISFHENL